MRIVRFRQQTGTPMLGILEDGVVFPVATAPDESATRMAVALAMMSNSDPTFRPKAISTPVSFAGLDLLTPLPHPPSIRDANAFEGHVRATRPVERPHVPNEWYEKPSFYFSNPHAIIGPNDPVAAPAESSELDYELEVAAVIGQQAYQVPHTAVTGVVAGFCVMNDFSARDIQRREAAVGLGPVKGKDFATALGAVFMTTSEFAPAGLRSVPDITMTATVNGHEYSNSNLATMYYSFAEIVAAVTASAKVYPGDIIGSGTCPTGCILEMSMRFGSTRYPYLRPGDVVQLEVNGLGTLRTPVAKRQADLIVLDSDRQRPLPGGYAVGEQF
jgi:2-keto-4-pentenoate hydratase/2-oxohepta-3-ene-1,7-dioic acid hydratase in catechol pathway